MPSYAGIGTMFFEQIIKHIIEEPFKEMAKELLHANTCEIPSGSGYYINSSLNGYDYKLHDRTLLIFVPGADATSSGLPKDFIAVMGRGQLMNYANLDAFDSSQNQGIILREASVEEDTYTKSMNAGMFNFGSIELAQGEIVLQGYKKFNNHTISSTTNGNLDINNLSSLTYNNIIDAIDDNNHYPNNLAYIAYFINANTNEDYAANTISPIFGNIDGNVRMKSGSIFMNLFDADVDRDSYRPFVRTLYSDNDATKLRRYGNRRPYWR